MSNRDAESVQWLARLNGQESSADRETFERWRKEPESAAAHERMERFWDEDLSLLHHHPKFAQLSEDIYAGSMPAARTSRRSPLIWAMAASVVVCALGASAFIAGQYYAPSRTYVTEMGQRSTIKLEDGSQVILNSDTQLKVRFTDERREFSLKRGEAVFTVAEEMHRPFAVMAGDGEVTALGTRFQVRNELHRVTVTLLEGRVALDRNSHGQHLQLAPGDQVRFNPEVGRLSQRTVDPKAASSWTLGYLEFEVTPLSEVLDEVNRYSQVKLRLKDPELARRTLSGSFEVGDTESVIAALQMLMSVETASRGRNEIVLSRRADAR